MSAADLALAAIDALLDAGVRDFVLCPGSRNAPMSLALAEADRDGRLRLHVRIDERSAAFLALGLAKAGGLPTAVLTTSGTAVANLHPAVIEAAMSHTPIAVISANRPLGMLGTGANQTIDQVGIFGTAARAAVHLDDRVPAEWDVLLKDATTQLIDSPDGPGPVQIDLGFTPPLVPAVPSPPQRTGDRRTETRAAGATGARGHDGEPLRLDLPPRTLVVVAECGLELAASAIESACAAGFPVHVEAGTALGAAGARCLRSGAFLLRSRLLEQQRPEHLVVVGRPTLSRPVPALATAGDVEVTVINDQPGLRDAMQSGAPALLTHALRVSGTVDREFADAWRRADDAAAAVIDARTRSRYDAGSVTATVAASEPDLLVLASSNPIRDLDERAVRRPQRVLVNRGVAGIDGLVSTAIGAALADQSAPGRTAVALLGDLAFLHDSNGLVIGPDEPRPDLTIVVVNNDGGAIFAGLEQGAAAHAEHFERVFGTPHGVDLQALCAATGTPHVRCTDLASLRGELDRAARGIRVIEAIVSRQHERAERRQFAREVVAAIDATL